MCKHCDFSDKEGTYLATGEQSTHFLQILRITTLVQYFTVAVELLPNSPSNTKEYILGSVFQSLPTKKILFCSLKLLPTSLNKHVKVTFTE